MTPPISTTIPTSLTHAAQKQMEPPPSFFQRAENLITGQRQADYGDKLQNFSQTAMIWTGLLAHKLLPGQQISPDDVAICMMGLKMSRLAKTPHHEDSILDIAGYAGCLHKLQEERVQEKELLGATVDSNRLQF